VIDCGGRPLELGRTAVMGILNVTPDSFSDGGRYLALDAALRQAELMRDQGADIIDVGGESTRPGAEPVPLQQELDRVIPVIEAVVEAVDIPISVDTSKPEVMQSALAAGAGLVNDVYALRAPGALEVVAAAGVPVCLMHMQGEPRTMQQQPVYDSVTVEVADFLRARAEACLAAGIATGRVLIDPGFGFGKTLAHNLTLLRELSALAEIGFPVLVGLSRKSMLAKMLDLPVDRRMVASVTLALIAVRHGAWVVRVHDVAETVEAIRTWETVYN
jgi:dihydropteroate synthase